MLRLTLDSTQCARATHVGQAADGKCAPAKCRKDSRDQYHSGGWYVGGPQVLVGVRED